MKVLEEIGEIFNLILEHPDDVSRMRFEARLKNGAMFRYRFDRQKWEKTRQRETVPKRETNQLINAVLDVVGIAASTSMLVILVVFASLSAGTAEVVCYSISGALLILYFLFSAIFNFLSPQQTAREFFFRFRGVLLFLTLAGFYLPFFLLYTGETSRAVFIGFMLLFSVSGLYFFSIHTKGAMKMAALAGTLTAWTVVAALPFMLLQANLFLSILIIVISLLLSFWVVSANREEFNPDKEQPVMNLFLLFASLCIFWIHLLWLNI